jgi:uncharacterized protein (TIGR00369 family)
MPHDIATALPPVMSADELKRFFETEFRQINSDGNRFQVETAAHGFSRVRMIYSSQLLRPGGTLSGPSMFALADICLYAAVLASIGPVALAVTTNMTINYLKKPGPCDMIGEARLIKLGKRLAVGEVKLYSEGGPDLIAHATGTYSIPDSIANA